jgi:hypothetical protein
MGTAGGQKLFGYDAEAGAPSDSHKASVDASPQANSYKQPQRLSYSSRKFKSRATTLDR